MKRWEEWAVGACIIALVLPRKCSRLFAHCWRFTGWWSLPELLDIVVPLDLFIMFTVFTLLTLMLWCNNSSFLCSFKILFNFIFLVTYNLYRYLASSMESWMQCLNSKHFWHLTFSLFSLCVFQAMNQYTVIVTFFKIVFCRDKLWMICSVKKEQWRLRNN